MLLMKLGQPHQIQQQQFYISMEGKKLFRSE